MNDNTGPLSERTLRGMELPRYEDLTPEEMANHLEQAAALLREGYGVQAFVVLSIPGSQTRALHKVTGGGDSSRFGAVTHACARQLFDRLECGLAESSECRIWSEI